MTGKIERFGNAGNLPSEAGKPTWLHLGRKSDQLFGSLSEDGENWTKGEPKELKAEAWAKHGIGAGIAVISTSAQTFSSNFSHPPIRHGNTALAEDIEPE